MTLSAMIGWAAEPFATSTAGRILLPAMASLLVAAIVGGIAWARYVTRSINQQLAAARETSASVAENTRDTKDLAQSVKDLASATHQLAIQGAVTSDQIQRHVAHHPGG